MYLRAGLLVSLVGLALLTVGSAAALAVTPASGGADPRSAALLKLELSRQGKSGMLPGGCTTLAGDHVCVPRVTVDGRRLSDLAVLTGDVSEATTFPGQHMPLQSPYAIRAGVAVAVFNDLVAVVAARGHITVTTKEARAFAQHELRLFEASPPRPGMPSPVPPGMTPRQYFLSPQTIAAYRQGMIIGQERDRIRRSYPRLSESLAFRRWLQGQLPKHTVWINGRQPDFSIAAAYPTS